MPVWLARGSPALISLSNGQGQGQYAYSGSSWMDLHVTHSDGRS